MSNIDVERPTGVHFLKIKELWENVLWQRGLKLLRSMDGGPSTMERLTLCPIHSGKWPDITYLSSFRINGQLLWCLPCPEPCGSPREDSIPLYHANVNSIRGGTTFSRTEVDWKLGCTLSRCGMSCICTNAKYIVRF